MKIDDDFGQRQLALMRTVLIAVVVALRSLELIEGRVMAIMNSRQSARRIVRSGRIRLDRPGRTWMKRDGPQPVPPRAIPLHPP